MKLARFGGDEFLILINEVHSREAILAVTELCMNHVRSPIEI